MSDDLPQGWVMASLGDVCSKPQYGWTCKASREGTIKYLRTTDISGGQIDWNSVPYCEEFPADLGKYRVGPNDILVSRAGSVGISYRIRGVPATDTVFASYLIRFKPLDGIQSEWVELFLRSDAYWRSISEFSAGIAVPNVNASKLATLALPLAPLAEQRRIVAKLERLLGKVDGCQRRLAKIPVLLKRFRQSVLVAACSGRLTADWREENPTTNSQTICDQDADLPEIPKSWQWVKLPETGELNRGRSRHRPRDEPSLYGGPFPFIQTGDIAQSGGKITSHRQSYSEAGLSQSRLWEAGTICITIAANIAESAILTYPACFPDSIVGITINPNVAQAEYIEFFIRVAKTDLATFAPATAQKNINIGILNAVLVPLPPPPEQHEIVRRVEALFALADRIEARYAAAKAQVDRLTPSLLARAFAGKLVPQDPSDEPASVVLERIQAKRNGQETSSHAQKEKSRTPRASCYRQSQHR